MLKFILGFSFRRDFCFGAEEGFLFMKVYDFGLYFKIFSLIIFINFIEDDNVGESILMYVDVFNFMFIL